MWLAQYRATPFQAGRHIMKLCNETKGYASPATAQTALEKALMKQGRNIGDVRWLIAVNDKGRYAPVVVYGRVELNICALANAGICVVN
jgi:hypothetical protein